MGSEVFAVMVFWAVIIGCVFWHVIWPASVQRTSNSRTLYCSLPLQVHYMRSGVFTVYKNSVIAHETTVHSLFKIYSWGITIWRSHESFLFHIDNWWNIVTSYVTLVCRYINKNVYAILQIKHVLCWKLCICQRRGISGCVWNLSSNGALIFISTTLSK